MELDCLIKGKTPTLSNHSSKTIKRKAKGENPTNFFPLKNTNKTQTRINESKQANKSIISNKEKKGEKMHIIETKKWSTHLSTQNYSIQFKFLSNKKPTKKWNTRPSTQNYSILFKFLSNNKPTKKWNTRPSTQNYSIKGPKFQPQKPVKIGIICIKKRNYIRLGDFPLWTV